MATKIILKKSNTAGAVPLTTDLEIGEVAINLADRKVYTKNNSNAVVTLGSAFVNATAPSAPAEGDLWYDSNNNYLKAYNGTAWTNVGYTTLVEFGVTATAEELNTLTGIAANVQGQLNSKANLSGATFVGPVLVSGSYVMANGVYSTDIVSAVGNITTQGTLTAALGISTSYGSFSNNVTVDGDVNIAPTKKYLINGVQHTHVVADITDFEEAVEDLIGANVAAGTGISVSYDDATGVTTISNTATDQAVSITAGAAITVTGSYPNFTVAHSDTSSQASVNNSGATVIQDVTLDTNGHVTGLASVEITPTLIGAAPSSHTHLPLQIIGFDEAARDAVGDFMSGTGIATVSYNFTTGAIVVNATEADTLDSVTDRGATTTNGITVGSVTTTGNVTVGGNLVVNGTTTTVNSNTVNIGDNIIVLNADETGTPSQNAGFEVERGTSANVQFIWNEVSDAWDMGNYPLVNVVLDGGSY